MDLNALEALANAATPGPWFRQMEGSRIEGDLGPEWWAQLYVFPENSRENGPMICLLSEEDHETQADAQFIAAARTAVPELIAEVRRLRGAVTRLCNERASQEQQK